MQQPEARLVTIDLRLVLSMLAIIIGLVVTVIGTAPEEPIGEY